MFTGHETRLQPPGEGLVGRFGWIEHQQQLQGAQGEAAMLAMLARSSSALRWRVKWA